MTYHFSPAKMATIKETDNNKCGWGCGKIRTLGPLLVEMENGAAGLRNSLVVLQKVEHKVIIWPGNSTPGYSPKGNESICPHRNLYTDVYNSIIRNSKKVEIIQLSISWYYR